MKYICNACDESEPCTCPVDKCGCSLRTDKKIIWCSSPVCRYWATYKGELKNDKSR